MMSFFRWVISIVCMTALTTAVFAQENNPGERLLERENRKRQIEGLARGSTGQEIKSPDVSGVVSEEVCFPIDVIHLEGVNALRQAVFSEITNEFSGQCLGQVSIGNLLQKISAVYADRGYITTRAYIPAQDISTRQLTVEVLEGTVEAFIYQQVDKNGQPRAGKPRKLKSAMPLQAGEVFQLRALEHGLEQMNRLRSSQASANLVAGEAPGTSRVVVTEQKVDVVRGRFGVDTRGDEVTGRTQLNFSLEADDIFGINDSYFVSYSGSENSNALAFSFSTPYRNWLFSASGSYSESLTPVTRNTDLFTQTANATLSAERLLFRDARSKYFAYVGVNSYWNERFINIAALTPQHRTAMSMGFRNEHRMENYVISADTSLTFGAPSLGGDENISPLTNATPRAKYTKLETRITYIRPFKNGRILTSTLVGQLSDTPLFSEEQLSIGGWESVRGYSGYSASGDNGAFIRTELSFPEFPLDFRNWGKLIEGSSVPNPVKNSKGGFRPFVFADAGHVSARATGRSSTMFSAGFGFLSSVGRTTLNGALAVPLNNENGQKAGDVQAFLNLTIKMF